MKIAKNIRPSIGFCGFAASRAVDTAIAGAIGWRFKFAENKKGRADAAPCNRC